MNWRTAVTWDGTPLRFHASEPVTILSQGFHLPVFRALLVAVFALAAAAHAATRVRAAPVPPEMRSGFFTVTVNGQRVDVACAASNYDFVSFDITGPAEISITAAEPGFWDGGVDIEPWRLGLRASREGATIRFRLPGPAKISISRPGDFLNDAKMLFLFAGSPPPPPPSGANVPVVPAGVHRESLNPKSGDTIYLEPGAYVFGSLNLWQVENVKVLGRGAIVYEGPQDPAADEGWMQKPDWHCIGAYQAHNVEIDGLTCIVRSRTWSIQMKDSSGFTYDDLRVIGGNPGNANQDGMDWLGGGDTVVRNAFLPRLRRRSGDAGQLGRLHPGRHGASRRTTSTTFSSRTASSPPASRTLCALDGRKKSSTRATSLCATPTFCMAASAPAARPSACSASGAQTAPVATTPELPLRICFSTTGTRWRKSSRSSPSCMDSSSATSGRSISRRWPSPRLPATCRDVTFDNVKYGQTRVTSDAQLPLVAAGGAAEPQFAPAPALVAAFTIDPQVFAPRTKGDDSPRSTRPARATPGCSATEPRATAAACAIASPTRSGPNSTAKTARAASGFCFM